MVAEADLGRGEGKGLGVPVQVGWLACARSDMERESEEKIPPLKVGNPGDRVPGKMYSLKYESMKISSNMMYTGWYPRLECCSQLVMSARSIKWQVFRLWPVRGVYAGDF